MSAPELKRHVVIAGGGRIGLQVAEALRRARLDFVMVEIDHRRFERAKRAGLPVVFGDATDHRVLEFAGIKDACLLLVTPPSVVVSQAIVAQAKRRNPRLDVVARVSDRKHAARFRDLGVFEVVLPEFEAGLEMTRQALAHLRLTPAEIDDHVEAARAEIRAPRPPGHGRT